MTKYAALGTFLRHQGTREVPMSFAEIERVTRKPLPASARRHRPWWSNNPDNSVMTKVWLEAGFKTEQVDMAGERLIFRRVKDEPTSRDPGESASSSTKPRRHPIFGCMKGTVTIAPGVDLTLPADPDWGKDD